MTKIIVLGIFLLIGNVSFGQTDSSSTPYPLVPGRSGGFYLNDPANFGSNVKYNPLTGNYEIVKTIGGKPIGTPTILSPEEYRNRAFGDQLKNYWDNKNEEQENNEGEEKSPEVAGGIIPDIEMGGETFDKIFGSNIVKIRPNGTAELIFAGVINRQDNPIIPERNRRTTSFQFDQKIQMNVTGQIGDKLRLQTNYDTENTFQFENRMKLEYTGFEDEIIKKIELGNVSLPLSGTLITGAQSLFGIKTQLQFGRATITAVFSEQKSETSVVDVQGGARTNDFEILGDAYEQNRHYFLSQYFRDTYNQALSNLPVVNSGINITKIEVWITNRNASTNGTRNIVGFMDLGESVANSYNDEVTAGSVTEIYPDNELNSLNPETFLNTHPGLRNLDEVTNEMSGSGFQQSIDFEKIENAKLLTPSEYSFNSKLGFISLNQQLNTDEVLAVAFQYTLAGKTYQVGEFSTDGIQAPQTLILKLLKATITSVKLPIWDLMMKNVYAIGAYQVNKDDFIFEVEYANDATGTPIKQIPEGAINGERLLKVLNLDNLNANNDPVSGGDGYFDFIDGVTINKNNGRIYFPMVEPFGDYLRAQFQGNDEIANKYVFDALYDSTKAAAQQQATFNKFRLKGSYKSSSSSEIPLNALNVPQGSVTVTAGGIKLTENIDYTVDYTLGRVKIINDGILNSGTPIRISLENNSLFNIQTKRFTGVHMDYRISKDFNLGASMLNLTERPLTQKINTGDEPISNTIWGLDGTYYTESRFLTRLIDKLPLIQTKEPSSVTITAEYAKMVPGHPKAIDIDEAGTSYVDDFEGSETNITLKSRGAWTLASVPQRQEGLFPAGEYFNDIKNGFNRANLAWYVVDPIFHRNNAATPEHLINNLSAQRDHRVREVLVREIFPNKDQNPGQPANLAVFDVAYYPEEKGPYNYDVEGVPNISSGLQPDGKLKDPETRWGGIMRKVETNNFEAANIQFIEFWMLDPFLEDAANEGGDLYFNLGSVSEDILRDSRKAFENGLPRDKNVVNVDTTAWGRVSNLQSIVNAFDNDPDARPFQDVGLDGLSDDNEKGFIPPGSTQSYLQRIAAIHGTGSTAYTNAEKDPSTDNFHYYRGTDYDTQELSILARYKRYNGMEGNSKTSDNSSEDYPTTGTTLPDVEDINRDQTLSESENYYQYEISVRQADLEVGKNYIVDKITTNVEDNNIPAVWYQFRIPIREPDQTVGEISDFRSIRFIRMLYKNFKQPIVTRFGQLDLVRGDWRRYEFALNEQGEVLAEEQNSETSFNISTVNIEENGSRTPIPYVLPPGIDRTLNFSGGNSLTRQNEQSLSLKVCDLQDGDGRAAFKNVDLDMRNYSRIKMFLHAEAYQGEVLNDGDLSAFMRLGSDYSGNYYEYEIPLQVTRAGASSNDDVWPSENEMDFDFIDLQKVKQARNDAMRDDPNVFIQNRYTVVLENGRKVTVVGSPNLSNIRTIMLGVRNPKKVGSGSSDDGLSKCGEIWLNELRLSEFNEEGGWAANARMTTKLADFATVSVAGSMSTIGFGSIEKNVQERNLEEIKSYDVSSNVALGKLLPEKAKVAVPLYVGVSEELRSPKYNPLDPDILLQASLENAGTPEERDTLARQSQTYVKRRSLNLSNVRKQPKQGAKARLYNISNFSASYSYNELYKRDINTIDNTSRNYRGSLAYNFSNKPVPFKPFYNIEGLKGKPWWKIVRDININYRPTKLTVRTDLLRNYNQLQLRNTNERNDPFDYNFNKSFNFNRSYGLRYDLTENISLNFNNMVNARIDEPDGSSDSLGFRDSIVANLLDFGRPTNYHHTVTGDWKLPLSKIPMFDWVTASVKYTGNYDWSGNSLGARDLDSVRIGNTIQNSQVKQLNGSLNLTTLYNKIPYFKKVNQGGRKPSRMSSKSGAPSTPSRRGATASDDFSVGKTLAKLVMTVQSVSATYSENSGTLMPGFLPSSGEFGGTNKDVGGFAPTAGFLLGMQDSDLKYDFANQGWLSESAFINQEYAETNTKNLNARASLEPFTRFRIDLTASRVKAENYGQYFTIDSTGYNGAPSITRGNFSMSFGAWATAFVKDRDDYSSATFDQFIDNRYEASAIIGGDRKQQFVDSTGYYSGYSGAQQEVIIPAFLAAYSGKSVDSYTDNLFPSVPIPNWRISYDGLSRLPFLKKHFRRFNLEHAYRSTYNVNSFTSDLDFEKDEDGFPKATRGDRNDFISKNTIGQVSISEQFSPLIKIDATLNNSLLVRAEFKKDRNISLSLNNEQITEVKGNEVVFGLGYRIKDLKIKMNVGGKRQNFKSDLNLKADLSIRDNVTVIRRISDNSHIPSGGATVFTLKTSADYVLNQRFNLRFFFDRVINTPRVSAAFPTANTNFGISVRFTLTE